ncbi:transposase, partial [Klebsiella pneumoniae]
MSSLHSTSCQRIGKIPGIGPVTASALIATIGKANNFENG